MSELKKTGEHDNVHAKRLLQHGMLRYHNITKDDMLNGDGLRVVLWVAGCGHHCKGCQNPITWDNKGGIPFDSMAEEELVEQLEKPYISGITFSGGDPLFPANREAITEIAKNIKETYPDKTIWVYSGYSVEEVAEMEIAPYIDVLVDGKYVEELRDVQLEWRGSANQAVIKLQDYLKNKDDLVTFTVSPKWKPLHCAPDWEKTHATEITISKDELTKKETDLTADDKEELYRSANVLIERGGVLLCM